MTSVEYGLTNVWHEKTESSIRRQPSTRSESRTAATSKMEDFVIIVNGFEPLTIIIKSSILDVAAILDPPLSTIRFRRVPFTQINSTEENPF